MVTCAVDTAIRPSTRVAVPQSNIDTRRVLSTPVARKACLSSPCRSGLNPYPRPGVKGEQQAVVEPKSLDRRQVDDYRCNTIVLHGPDNRVAITTAVSLRLRSRRNLNAGSWTTGSAPTRHGCISKTLSIV